MPNFLIKVRFKIIDWVDIFAHNFINSRAILLIFSYIVGIEELFILSYSILKMKQNGAQKMKKKKYNFYSFACIYTKRISMESAILARLENISFDAFARLFAEL